MHIQLFSMENEKCPSISKWMRMLSLQRSKKSLMPSSFNTEMVQNIENKIQNDNFLFLFLEGIWSIFA